MRPETGPGTRELESMQNEIILDQIIENIPYFVFWKDIESKYLGGNKRFALSAGFSSVEEMIGKDDYDSCWTKEEADFFRKIDREVMDFNKPMLNIEEPQKQLSGETKILLTSKVPLHNSSGKVIGILGIYTDITERKNLEDEKDRALKELKEIQSHMIHSEKMRSLGEMAGGIAHEINNPLMVIKSGTAVLKKLLLNESTDKTKLFETIERIESTVKRISDTVTSLRTISREDLSLQISYEKISDIIQEVESLCSEKLRYMGIDLQLRFEKDQDNEVRVACNRIGLSQVLLNILNNSTDAIINQKDKWIRIEVSVDQICTIRILDSGAGIPNDIVDKMFQPFFTTKPVGKGTGIGLSLSRSLIERQSGSLTYESERTNTCFKIQLPIENTSSKH